MLSNTLQIEKSLLTGKWQSVSETPNQCLEIAEKVVNGSFREALTSSYAQKLFTLSSTDIFGQALDLTISLSDDETESELLRLVIAVAFLHAFVQANWTGPDLDVQPLDVLVLPADSPSLTEEELDQKAVSSLAYGGEPAYHLTRQAAFLKIAQMLLDVPYNHCQTIVWWRLRTHLIHQQVLDEPVVLSEDILATFERWQNPFASNDPELAGRFPLEHGLLYHTFSQDKIAAEYFVKAARATDLQYELTGALGKRTKFQQNELSQLVLLAESHLLDDADEKEITASENKAKNESLPVPETLALNDDTLLEQTEFTSSNPSSNSRLSHIDPVNQPSLHPLDQCILLSLCLNVRNMSPLHGLTSEQMSPYVARVISHPRNWSIHTMALLLRSRLESTRTRTVERSTLQLQALVDQMPATDKEAAPIPERLHFFHSISLPTKWEMEKELAERFISLGVIRSALEIFERLEMWEEVVKCHVSLEKAERGVSIVRELLEGTKVESETIVARGKAGVRQQILDKTREAKLWCILGDLEPENAVQHYKRAWEISGETSGRAVRSLGGYYFARGEYQDAIGYLRRAVKINPLLSRSWFILGCACMRVEDWDGGREAFGRCVAIDEEDGESWSNLANMYLRMGTTKEKEDEDDEDDSNEKDSNIPSIPHSNKLLAYKALKMGLKHAYDNWRMWSNYMIIAVDVGELAEACRALSRVVEETSSKSGVEGTVLDEDVLDRLVNAVTRAPSDPEDAVEKSPTGQATAPVVNPNEGHGLLPRVLDLFENTILPRVSTARVFRAYARLMIWQGRWDDALKAWMDAYRESEAGRISRGESDVVNSSEADAARILWNDAIGEVEEIVEVLRNLGGKISETGRGKKWKLQARTIVRSFMARTKESFEDDSEWGRLEGLLEELKQE
ncbi:tetratricopeptide repeat domain 27 [Dendrothele bispora CBS 962.96]|uniref:Tetratricopeptide repeat domain 27 n=1 Tax=Dendrothele bispora (strain CBS 962.96) TaxID=1314807 RepID=A0A4S8MZ39_DENBC|nr:tetratricopeptide repeat domain 27 [Dendrothele bispora CBS 962.96]